MANVKVCRIFTADYIYKEFFAIFAPLVAFIPKDTVPGGQFREDICLVAAGILNKTRV